MQEYLNLVLAHLRGMWRFRWHALALAWLFAIVGWLWVYSLPNIYEARARVYVDTDTALEPLLSGLAIDSDVMGQVSLMTRALLTKPQLERIARETGMYARVRSREDEENLIASLSSRISIFREGEESIFTIQFQDPDRKMAEGIVAAFLASFVQDSLSAKRDDTDNAQRFLEEQIDAYAARLTAAEQRLADFKRENVGLMPGEGGDYYDRLETAMGRRQQYRDELSLAERRRDELQEQLEGEQPIFGLVAPRETPGGPGSAKLNELRARLAELRLRYTDKHPEIVGLLDTIEILEAQQVRDAAAVGGSPNLSAATNPLDLNPVYQKMKMQLSTTDVEIVNLRGKLAAEQRKVDELQRLVDTIPEVEAQLARLNRDYDVTRSQYEELLQRLETARISDEARESTSDVKFKVIDPTRAPLEPVAPHRKLFLAVVLFWALVSAVLLAFALNQLKPVYGTVRSLLEKTGLPVLGSISLIRTAVEIRRRRMATMGLAMAVFLLFVSFGFVIGFEDTATGIVQSWTASEMS